MDINNAGNFLIQSLLFSLGFLVIGVGVLILNNIFSKFWKPIRFLVYHTAPALDKKDPKLDDKELMPSVKKQ